MRGPGSECLFKLAVIDVSFRGFLYWWFYRLAALVRLINKFYFVRTTDQKGNWYRDLGM